MHCTDLLSRFETQLQAVKERLEAAKVSARNLPNSPTGPGPFGAGARIAKPLRGGGGIEGGSGGILNGAPSIPVLSSLQSGEGTPSSGKRTSWFFNKS